MDYKKLKTKSLLSPLKKKTKKITAFQIKKELMWCHNNFSFSTYSYCGKNYTSKGFGKKVIDKTSTGNCIALSYGLQKRIKKKYGVSSYLIPATVPKHIERPGYLELSHVALMIPGSEKWVFYIADPAFYFIEPIKVDFRRWKVPGKFKMSNIYSENYDNVEEYFSKVGITIGNTVLNKYQNIPPHTPFVICSAVDPNKSEVFSDWTYFITEITNPDAAITSFFMKVWEKTPFITKTQVINNKVICKLSIRQKDDGNITIKENNRPIYNGLAKKLTKPQVSHLRDLFEIPKKDFEKFVINREECSRYIRRRRRAS